MGEQSSPDAIKWVSTASISNGYQKLPEPKYSVFGERIRHVAPSSMQCSMFCGGRQCKYCNPSKFKKEPNQDAIDGLYSAWVTSDILATSRPSTDAIKQFKIIEQFHKHEIRTIINLQHPGEHAACGFGLEQDGFSYIPQDFMDNNVFFYNFGWNDYGVRSLQSILDMVKVFDFALSNGKAAVHCHAGLGRTGVLIACYLIYSTRITPHEAIMKVREARPKAIQTRGQINCVNDFFTYIRPMWKIFSDDDDQAEYTFTLKEFMNRQRHILHGEESRTLRFVPKIVYTICSRLLTLAEIDFDLSKSAIVTHFGFMRDSSLNSSKKEESKNEIRNDDDDDDYDDENLEPIEETKSHLPVEEEVEGGEDVEEDSRTSHSDNDELLYHTYQPTVQSQVKASSTPNVPAAKNKSPIDMPPKKGGVQLEPIAPRKSKRKKKKAIQDRVKELKSLGEFENRESNNCLDNESTLSSLPPILKNLDASFDASTKSFNGYNHIKRNFKPDSISLASFSSTANEGLSQTEVILKHLAFRSSDLTVSTQVERYKRKLNAEDSAWECILQESNAAVLSGLMWSWLSQLQNPVLDDKVMESLKENIGNHEQASESIDKDVWKLMKFFVIFLSKLTGKQEHFNRILRRFSVIMTNDDLSKDAMEEGVSIETASSGVIFYVFATGWLKSMMSD